MTRTPVHNPDTSNFESALRLYPTVEAVVEHNVTKLHSCGQPVATIKAVHTVLMRQKPLLMMLVDYNLLSVLLLVLVLCCPLISGLIWVL